MTTRADDPHAWARHDTDRFPNNQTQATRRSCSMSLLAELITCIVHTAAMLTHVALSECVDGFWLLPVNVVGVH